MAGTPTIRSGVPGVDKADELKAKGIDEIAVTAVNDAFVLGKWTEDAKDITPLADGNGATSVSVEGLEESLGALALLDDTQLE